MLYDFGFFKIDGDIVYQNKPVGMPNMEQCTSTNSPDSDVELIHTNNLYVERELPHEKAEKES